MLQRNDPLVRCLTKQERTDLSGGQEALYYLFIDGESAVRYADVSNLGHIVWMT